MTLLRQQGFGADMLEVGYALGRAGVELGHYLGLWDTMSRNASFMTGTGVSDDHTGTRWLAQRWNYVTWAWADSTAEPALLDALAAGRAWFGDPAQYRGAVDLLVDGYAPMGSVTVVTAGSRAVTVTATDLPSGGWVDLMQGVVDYAGTMDPNPLVTRITIPRAAVATGSTTMDLSTPSSRFVRAEVFDASGVVVAYSNPVWLLREPPVLGVPPARAA